MHRRIYNFSHPYNLANHNSGAIKHHWFLSPLFSQACVDFKCVNATNLLPDLKCDAKTTCNGNGVSGCLLYFGPKWCVDVTSSVTIRTSRGRSLCFICVLHNLQPQLKFPREKRRNIDRIFQSPTNHVIGRTL